MRVETEPPLLTDPTRRVIVLIPVEPLPLGHTRREIPVTIPTLLAALPQLIERVAESSRESSPNRDSRTLALRALQLQLKYLKPNPSFNCNPHLRRALSNLSLQVRRAPFSSLLSLSPFFPLQSLARSRLIQQTLPGNPRIARLF